MSEDKVISIDSYVDVTEPGEKPDLLTEKQERFCLEYMRNGGNVNAAYRAAYNPPITTKTSTINAAASAKATNPKIRRRINALLREIEVDQRACIKQIIQDWIDQASADPNELVSVAIGCCRFCHGANGEYQWEDADEYTSAVELAEAKAKVSGQEPKYPTDTGGYGFDFTRSPNSECKKCHGEGIPRHIVHDTRKLSPQASKLYKGSKINQKGMIEIVMHDPQEARKSLARVFALFQDNLNVKAEETKKIPEGISQEEVSRAYNDLMGKS